MTEISSHAKILINIYGCALNTAETFADPIFQTMTAYDIDTPLRRAAFLSQIGHESGRLLYMREIWGPSTCPWQLKYDNNKSLGNVFTGDGYRFRGGGLLQLTGRDNYRRCGHDLGLSLVENPDLITRPIYAAMTAGWFWDEHNLNAPADADDMREITRRINGGYNGIKERLLLYNRALEVVPG